MNANANELRLGFSNTTRNPEGVLSHNAKVPKLFGGGVQPV
jgi:hypothetical protein